MKIKISILLIISMFLSMFITLTASAATTNLTERETKIIKAYVKTLETGKTSHINKFASTKIKISESNLKFISPKYSREYDKVGKTDCLTVTGIVATVDEGKLVLYKGKMGVSIVTQKKVIYATDENSNIAKVTKKLTIDDLTEKQVKTLKTFLEDNYGEAKAKKLMASKNTTKTDTTDSKSTTTKATGSLTNPIPMGETYTYTLKKEYLVDTLSGTYSFTVNSSKSITSKEILALGFQVQENAAIEYRLVNVKWNVKDAVLKKVDGSGEIYKSLINPEFWGCKTLKGYSIIGITSNSFEKSLGEGIKDIVGSTKAKAGEKVNYTASGNIIVSVAADDADSYLVITDNSIDDYNNSKIHFKLTK